MHESTLQGESLLLRASSLTLHNFNKFGSLVFLFKARQQVSGYGKEGGEVDFRGNKVDREMNV